MPGFPKWLLIDHLGIFLLNGRLIRFFVENRIFVSKSLLCWDDQAEFPGSAALILFCSAPRRDRQRHLDFQPQRLFEMQGART